MTDTNLTQRDNADWLANTAELVKQACARADQAEWDNHPNAHRLRHEASRLRERYMSGEVVTPRF